MGADLVGLHHQPDRLGQLVEELVVGVGGAPLQLQDDVLLMAAHGGVKVAAGVNLVHQLPHHGGAGLPLIAGVAGQHRPAVIVQGVQSHHVAIVVIVHLDLRVHAQKYGADAAAVLLLKRGGLAGGLGERGRSGATPTGSQGSQSQGGSQGQAKQFDAEVLFHFIHLLENRRFCMF